MYLYMVCMLNVFEIAYIETSYIYRILGRKGDKQVEMRFF